MRANRTERATHERLDNPANGAETSTDETAATATASASTDAATPHLVHSASPAGEQVGQQTTDDVEARTKG